MKTLVQCDFDGTLTEEDVSFLILDEFANGDWRQLLQDYKDKKIPVGVFGIKAFAMVTADRPTIDKFVRAKARVRPGLQELIAYCQQMDYTLVIVSNGVDFYIETILGDLGINHIEVHASQAQFNPDGMIIKYIGPDGKELTDCFKDAYIKQFLSQGYRVVYVGNGVSDMSAARYAHHIFATEGLLNCCRQENTDCTPFSDLNDVVKGLKALSPTSGCG